MNNSRIVLVALFVVAFLPLAAHAQMYYYAMPQYTPQYSQYSQPQYTPQYGSYGTYYPAPQQYNYGYQQQQQTQYQQPSYQYQQPTYQYQPSHSSYPQVSYSYQQPTSYPQSYSYPVGRTDGWGSQLCYWSDYPSTAACGTDPQQWIQDPYTGRWY